MMPPFQNTLLGPIALYSAVAVVATGCGADTGTVAAGAGLGVAALGAVAWTTYRRLSRIRTPGIFASLPAAVRLQTPSEETTDIRAEFLRRSSLLKEKGYAPVLNALSQRTARAWKAAGSPPELKPFIDSEIASLLESLRNRQRNTFLQRLLDALDPPAVPPTPPPRFSIASAADVKALEPYLLGDLATEPEARDVLAVLCTKGLEHPESDVVATSSTLLDRMIEERLSPGLKPDSDLFTAIDAVMILKTVGLLAKNEAMAGRAIETLAMEGIFHADMEVATLAIKSLTEIVDSNPSRLPSTSLIALRLRGFAPGTSPTVTAAAIEALSKIAAPAGSPAPNPADSIQALQILFWDGLRQNEEIVALTRRALNAAFERRPEIFSEEMRNQLPTQ